MQDRLSQLKDWLQQQNTFSESSQLEIVAVAGDASFRRYFRVKEVAHETTSYIAMDAPPEHEDCVPFVSVTRAWLAYNIPLPQIFAEDLENGFLLLEDFGNEQFFDSVSNAPIAMQTRQYESAIDELMKIQAIPTDAFELPPYDFALLDRELRLFTEWLIGEALNIELSEQDADVIENAFDHLIDNALTQIQVPVHRDYHSRNLMISDNDTPENQIGIIDFQDAVTGPITYDLVSLLKDCYILLEPSLVEQLASTYKHRSLNKALAKLSTEQFIKQFDLMGIQRHMKAAGIFARLSIRDNKHSYLQDIPRTFNYILEACDKYPEFGELAQLFRTKVQQAMLDYVAKSSAK